MDISPVTLNQLLVHDTNRWNLLPLYSNFRNNFYIFLTFFSKGTLLQKMAYYCLTEVHDVLRIFIVNRTRIKWITTILWKIYIQCTNIQGFYLGKYRNGLGCLVLSLEATPVTGLCLIKIPGNSVMAAWAWQTGGQSDGVSHFPCVTQTFTQQRGWFYLRLPQHCYFHQKMLDDEPKHQKMAQVSTS